METYYCQVPGKDRFSRTLRAAGLRHTKDIMADWDVFVPKNGNRHVTEMRGLLPNRVDQWVCAIPDSYWISNKANLWAQLRRRDATRALMPQTWLVRQPRELDALRAQWKPGMRVILKDPTRQRREGLRLCDDPADIPAAIAENFIVAQQLAEDLELIDGHRFHLRVYLLVTRQDRRFSFWLYNEGRVIYAPDPAEADTIDAWVTRSVGSDALPPGRPFLISEMALRWDGVEALLKLLAQSMLRRLRPAWTLGSNPAMQLFGADLLLRTDGRFYILECNRGPDMKAKCGRDEALKQAVISDQVAMMGLDAGGSWPGGFRLIYRASPR